MTAEGNLQLCNQTQSSRLILVKPNMFNTDNNDKLKEKIFNYLAMFRYEDCLIEKIPVFTIADPNKETYNIYQEDDFLIRDSIDSKSHEVYRQLVFKENQSEIQSEVKLRITTKNKLKEDGQHALTTINKYKDKGLLTCLDDNFICSFYIKCLLTGIAFLNTSKDFPGKKLRILILGSGIGSINFYFHKIFKDNVTIDSVEIDKRYKEIGEKYFGFSANSNDSWHFEDAREYIKRQSKECSKDATKKYDMIIIDINNLNRIDGISPPPDFFNSDNVNNIYVKIFSLIYIKLHY